MNQRVRCSAIASILLIAGLVVCLDHDNLRQRKELEAARTVAEVNLPVAELEPALLVYDNAITEAFEGGKLSLPLRTWASDADNTAVNPAKKIASEDSSIGDLSVLGKGLPALEREPGTELLVGAVFSQTDRPNSNIVQSVIAGKGWSFTVPFVVRHTSSIEKLIQCESRGANISRPDRDGIISDGILQFHRATSTPSIIGSGTWHWMSLLSRIHGSPILPADAIKMADWAIDHGLVDQWSCARKVDVQNLSDIPRISR